MPGVTQAVQNFMILPVASVFKSPILVSRRDRKGSVELVSRFCAKVNPEQNAYQKMSDAELNPGSELVKQELAHLARKPQNLIWRGKPSPAQV